MKKILFVLCTCALTLASCGGNKNSVDFEAINLGMIEAFTKANEAVTVFDGKITEGVTSNDFASIAVAADTAIVAIDKQIEAVNAIAVPENGKAYQEATVKSLNVTKDLVEVGRKYSDLKEGYTPEEFATLDSVYNVQRTVLSQELANVATAAQEFVQAYAAPVVEETK